MRRKLITAQVCTGAVAGLLLLASSTALADAGISPQRQSQLTHLLLQDCGSCHGMTLKGGLGSPLLPANLAGKPDALLVDTILNGRPDTAMPPWRTQLNRDEAQWLIEMLRRGVGDAGR